MNKNIEMKLAMYERLLATLREHQSIVDQTPALSDVATRLENEISFIHVKSVERKENTKWVTNSKNEKLDSMLTLAFQMSKILKAHAHITGNKDLFNNLNVTCTQFMAGGSYGKMVRVDRLITELQIHISSLAIYGLTEEDLAGLIESRKTLEEHLVKPRLEINNRSVLRKQILEHVVNAKNLISIEMDPFMVLLSKNHPQFYDRYMAARKLVHYSTRSNPKGNDLVDRDDGQ